MPDPRALDLMTEIRRGDQRALRTLYDREGRRLFAIALRITGRRDHAADALQDTFIEVWQNAAKFNSERGSLEAWLTGIVRYRALDARRRHGSELEISGSDAAANLTAEFDDLLTHKALQHCLGELDSNQRQTIILAYIEGFSHAEIASRTAAPLGTVKSWVRRGLLSLRSCLEP